MDSRSAGGRRVAHGDARRIADDNGGRLAGGAPVCAACRTAARRALQLGGAGVERGEWAGFAFAVGGIGPQAAADVTCFAATDKVYGSEPIGVPPGSLDGHATD